MSFLQYLKDTQGELRHVAWPTQFQTIVYTIIVIALSIFIALYLGLFDYIFTTGLRSTLELLPQQTISTNANIDLDQATTIIGTSTPLDSEQSATTTR